MKKMVFILGTFIWSATSGGEKIGSYVGLPGFLFSHGWIKIENCDVPNDELKRNPLIAPTLNKCLEEISTSKTKMASLGYSIVLDTPCHIGMYNLNSYKKCDVAINGSVTYSK